MSHKTVAMLPILQYPHSRLKTVAALHEISAQTHDIINSMFETMYQSNGIGLAATQCDIHQQIIVIDLQKPDSKPLHLINPKIIELSGEQDSEEGCLSFPGVYDMVKRAMHVKVKAIDKDNNPFELEATGLLAAAIQHEIDHLNGALFIERLSILKKQRAIEKYNKLRSRNI
ncbi:MAG: peptide deformylase [uncultured bacterium]|nr:MAG: peptide deformylase [uncultured bacterium]